MITEETHSILLTPKAAAMVKKTFIAQGMDPQTQYLRVGAQVGGCSGYKYDLQPAQTDQISDADLVFKSEGVNLVVNKECLEKVLGSVRIDFQDQNLIDRGFKFERLSSAAMCGCGESFAPISGSP